MMLAFVEDTENTTSCCLEDDTTIISRHQYAGYSSGSAAEALQGEQYWWLQGQIYRYFYSLAVEAGLFLSTQVGYLLFFFSVSTWITITAFYADIGSLLFQEETYTAEIPGPSCSKRR